MERLHKKINKLEANKDELSVKLEKLELKGKGDQSSALKLKDKVSSNFCLSDKDAMQHNRHWNNYVYATLKMEQLCLCHIEDGGTTSCRITITGHKRFNLTPRLNLTHLHSHPSGRNPQSSLPPWLTLSTVHEPSSTGKDPYCVCLRVWALCFKYACMCEHCAACMCEYYASRMPVCVCVSVPFPDL